MAHSCVKVSFEIGHEASIRAKRTPEGFTHDWEVFVRGVENNEIFHFVEKGIIGQFYFKTFASLRFGMTARQLTNNALESQINTKQWSLAKEINIVKEPPYSVKESGYAGFNLPIDIYFKNSDEPKKVRFNYDLHLQTSGPPISKVSREQYVFPNPAEDLRRRLLRAGGVGVGLETTFHLSTSEKVSSATIDEPAHKHNAPALVGKPKLSGSDSSKKHKVKEGKADEPRVSNSFQDLFGTPIKTAKISPDPKKSSSSSSSSHSPKVSPVSKPSKSTDKPGIDKTEKSNKSSKHSSQRESKDSSERTTGGSSSSIKEDKKDKEKSRDKEKSKEKPSKRPSTPVKPPSTPPKRPQSPAKRPPSPSPPKRPASPSKTLAPPPTSTKLSSPKHSSSSKSSKDESKKPSSEENKNKGELKPADSSKSEKKKKDKKNRDDKPKKDKHKEHDKSGEKTVKSEKSKDPKEKDVSKKPEKETIKETEKPKEKEKSKHNEGDKEKQRHKHKKKDKSSKDREKDKDKEKERSSKKSSENKISAVRDKEKNGLSAEPSRVNAEASGDVLLPPHKKQPLSSPSPSPARMAVSPLKPSPTPEKPVIAAPSKEKLAKHPLNMLYEKVTQDSSDSNSSALSADEDLEATISRVKPAKTTENRLTPVENKTSVLPVPELQRPNSRSEGVKPKSEHSSQERNSLNKSSSKQKEKSSKKNKDRESGGGEKLEKDSKKRKRKSSSRVLEEAEGSRNNGEASTKIPKLVIEGEEACAEPEQEPELEKVATAGESEAKGDSEPEEAKPPAAHLTEEYVSQLRELQHKIMTLEDNAELQRVVQVIAETGQYEITKKTFDFDLCALDRSTVKRLQEFFAPS